LIYLFNVLFCNRVLSYFAKPNFIVYDEWFNDDLKKSYNQVKKELRNYSKDLIKKKELIVLNKIDLLDKDIVKKTVKNFSKDKNCEVLTLSTLEKDSISKIKAKLISYVS